MKIDFRKIEVTDIEGNKSTFDISKELGNTIYQKTADRESIKMVKSNCRQTRRSALKNM